MTEEELKAFEELNRSRLGVKMTWRELQAMTAEIRRAWARIAELEADRDEWSEAAVQYLEMLREHDLIT